LKKWAGPEQFEDPTGELMMLPSDMALLWDKGFRAHVERYAADQDAFFADFAKVCLRPASCVLLAVASGLKLPRLVHTSAPVHPSRNRLARRSRS
jgi:hypothetical protein